MEKSFLNKKLISLKLIYTHLMTTNSDKYYEYEKEFVNDIDYSLNYKDMKIDDKLKTIFINKNILISSKSINYKDKLLEIEEFEKNSKYSLEFEDKEESLKFFTPYIEAYSIEKYYPVGYFNSNMDNEDDLDVLNIEEHYDNLDSLKEKMDIVNNKVFKELNLKYDHKFINEETLNLLNFENELLLVLNFNKNQIINFKETNDLLAVFKITFGYEKGDVPSKLESINLDYIEYNEINNFDFDRKIKILNNRNNVSFDTLLIKQSFDDTKIINNKAAFSVIIESIGLE
jgi:hypothetical protein